MLTLDRPSDSDTHTVADFAELLCLLTIDRTLSRATLADYVKDVGEQKLTDTELDDAFGHFAWRVAAFGAVYPFTLDQHGNVVSAPEHLSQSQRLYVLLLLCANLPFLAGARRQALTDAFERASYCALRKLLPDSAVVRAFGKNETDYVGTKVERLTQLAKDIGAKPVLSDNAYRAKDTGDGGIDVVAWVNLDSYELRNKPAALAQCACSRKQWKDKQHEISSFQLGAQIVATHPWMEIVFIPHCFRDNTGSWAHDGLVARVVLVDRLRLLTRLEADTDSPQIDAPPVLDEFLAARLELV